MVNIYSRPNVVVPLLSSVHSSVFLQVEVDNGMGYGPGIRKQSLNMLNPACAHVIPCSSPYPQTNVSPSVFSLRNGYPRTERQRSGAPSAKSVVHKMAMDNIRGDSFVRTYGRPRLSNLRKMLCLCQFQRRLHACPRR